MAENSMNRQGLAEPVFVAPVLDEEGEGESFIDVLAMIHTFRRGKRMIFWSSLGCFAIATLIAFVLPFQYTSAASFIPPGVNGSSSMASAVAGQLSALGAGDLMGGGKNSGDIYAGILRSRSIASELVQRFDLAKVYRVKRESQAEKMLASNTSVVVDIEILNRDT